LIASHRRVVQKFCSSLKALKVVKLVPFMPVIKMFNA
jgi:hypothetical protein